MATIEARIMGVTRKKEGSPWFTIKTDHDRIKTLETKYRERAEEAFTLQKSGEVAIIEFSSNPRTDESSGRTYENNYFERAKTKVEEPQQTLDEIPTETPVRSATNPGDAWRISLAAGAKLAVATLPLLDEDQRDFSSQQELAYAWGTFLYTTPFGSQVPVGVGAPGNGASATEFNDFGPPPGDDDIPF